MAWKLRHNHNNRSRITRKKTMSLFNVPTELKTQLLTERIAQLNIEGYQHELNKATAEAVGNDQAVLEAESAIAIIVTAIEVAETQLSN